MSTGVTDGERWTKSQVALPFCNTGFRKKPRVFGAFSIVASTDQGESAVIDTELLPGVQKLLARHARLFL